MAKLLLVLNHPFRQGMVFKQITQNLLSCSEENLVLLLPSLKRSLMGLEAGISAVSYEVEMHVFGTVNPSFSFLFIRQH